MRLSEFCYTLTDRVMLRNDARPYKIMMYLYKDVSKDDINFYSNWIPFAPQIIKDKKAASYPSGKLTIKMRKRRIFNKAL